MQYSMRPISNLIALPITLEFKTLKQFPIINFVNLFKEYIAVLMVTVIVYKHLNTLYYNNHFSAEIQQVYDWFMTANMH